MTTRAFASTVIPVPIEQVWEQLRDFTFPGKLISGVTKVTMEGGQSPWTVGAVRQMTWKNGETRRHRLLTLSDVDYTMTWELTPSEDKEVSSNVNGCMTTIQLHRISDTKHTYISWSSIFTPDVTPQMIRQEEEDYAMNLKEIRTQLTKASV